MSQSLDDRRVAALLVLVGAGVWCGVHAAPPGVPMWDLEFAGSVQRVLQLGGDPAALRVALAWDYGFLLCYGLFLALFCSSLGTLIGDEWEKLGGLAAVAGLVAAVLDAIENAGLLHALEGREAGAQVAWAAAFGKWLLVFFSSAVALWLVLRWFSRDKLVLPPLPAPGAWQGPVPDRLCDVVMKGGITSGIVYPRAVNELSKAFRFVNVGGASAGAIAAGATAAAEYARAQGRDAFRVLDVLPEWLGHGGRLFSLFQPNDLTRGPFEVFVAFLGRVPLPVKLARAAATAAAYFPLWLLLALAGPVALAWGALQSPTPAWGVSAATATAAVLLPLMLAVGLVVGALRALPKNGFGLSTGHVEGEERLSAWLDGLLSSLSGVTDRPLTFGDLASAGVNFEALTTSLSEGRPYRLPDSGRAFYFRREDLEPVLPKRVVDHLVSHASKDVRQHEGFYALPAPGDLPVVLAVRLSLSFPFLLSAVRFWVDDYTDGTDDLVPCWLSDGGISSNFPIHFFDGLVPSRPTFGLDLGPFHPRHPREREEEKNVFLPTHNNSGHSVRINPIEGVGGFIGALVNAMQAFLDNMQMRSAGYRDRVARIFLDTEEGGLNLIMPPELLQRLGARGGAAGRKLVQRFVEGDGWKNHRWVRLRSLLAMMHPHLKDFRTAMQDPSWRELLESKESYPLDDDQRRMALEIMRTLEKLGDAQSPDLTVGAPRPAPQLRGTPRV